ncbi:MAG: GNAT family N-acetyltransferase [Thermoprotei archaeon]
MTSAVVVVDNVSDRRNYEWILEEGFSGLYLWHARRMLYSAESVKVALVGGDPVGLVIPKRIGADIGYVYYIAVARRFRGRGVGGALLDNTLRMFAEEGRREVYASIEHGNTESIRLFTSRGFRPTGFDELEHKYGLLRATKIYAEMLVVRGETLYVLVCGAKEGAQHAST